MTTKLLVNTPLGTQEVIEILEGGGYFDLNLVLWDERIDGPLPEITIGGMIRDGDNLLFSEELFNSVQVRDSYK